MKHSAIFLALIIAAPAAPAFAVTLPGAVTTATGNTTLSVGDTGSLTLTATASDPTAQALSTWGGGDEASQFTLEAEFIAPGSGAIYAAITEGDQPGLLSG